jgi:hypothetical protein
MPSRSEIVEYFKKHNPDVANVLAKKIKDQRFPFNTIYTIATTSREKIDLMSFILITLVFHKYKEPMELRSIANASIRGDNFITKAIETHQLYTKIMTYFSSVYVAYNILDEVIRNDFVFFRAHFEPNSYEDHEYILIDYHNVYNQIVDYTGDNPDIQYIKDTIIGTRKAYQCLDEFIEYFETNLNPKGYKLTFFMNREGTDLTDLTLNGSLILSVDCERIIGEKCGKETYTNETDDAILLMLYDYIEKTYKHEASILAHDNYDFAMMSQDTPQPLRKALISDTVPAYLKNSFDIEEEHPEVDTYIKNLRLHSEIFEELLV